MKFRVNHDRVVIRGLDFQHQFHWHKDETVEMLMEKIVDGYIFYVGCCNLPRHKVLSRHGGGVIEYKYEVISGDGDWREWEDLRSHMDFETSKLPYNRVIQGTRKTFYSIINKPFSLL